MLSRRAVNENPDLTADSRSLRSFNDPPLPSHHSRLRELFHRRRDIVWQAMGRGAYFVLVGEDPYVVEPDGFDERLQLCKVCLRLTRESDDERCP